MVPACGCADPLRWTGGHRISMQSEVRGKEMTPTPSCQTPADFRVLSPPVVQNATEDSFAVAWAVSGCATGAVEWGLIPELGHTSVPTEGGRAVLGDSVLSVRVDHGSGGKAVHYRVVTRPVVSESADSLQVGPPIRGPLRQLQPPRAEAKSCHLTVINDTHAHGETVQRLAERIDEANPDLLLWNGDVADFIDTPQSVAAITLTPGQDAADPAAGGWASSRPLIYLPGNHDVRGRPQTLPKALLPWPRRDGEPRLASAPGCESRYCFAQRLGPLALVGLDTGEDKPDWRFEGLAAFEPYREAQREWLEKVLQKPEIATAPYLITICHIPLHGLPGDNDGTGAEGFAFYSGFGQRLWGPLLREAGCQAVISGHMHIPRIDPPTPDFPMHQVVGGGPKVEDATLIHLRAGAGGLDLTMENLAGDLLGKIPLPPRS